MKTLLFIAIAFLSVACSDLTDQKHFYVDSKLILFVDNFYKEASKRNVKLQHDNLLLLIKDLPGNENGVTYSYKSEVDISKYVVDNSLGNPFNDYTDSLKVEFIIFHELGHYLLKRDHVPNSVYSIMTFDETYISDYQTDSTKRQKLINELFKP